MASNPISSCCTIGVKHEGEPVGAFEDISGVPTYISKPTGKVHEGKAVLFLTDVLGLPLVNNKLIADQYAANGYLTVVPDILHDDAIPVQSIGGPDFNIMNWFNGIAPEGKVKHTPDTVFPIVEKAVQWLRGQGIKKIGVVGYCYGAKYAVVASNNNQVDAVFIAHPSFVDEAEIEALNHPLSIAAAETDRVFPIEKRHKTEELLIAGKKKYQVVLYSGVEHGFAVKGDLSNPEVKFAKEQAFIQAVQWFDQWL